MAFRLFRRGRDVERQTSLSLDDYLSFFKFGGHTYGLSGVQQTLTSNREEIGSDFSGLVQGAYRQNGVVFACMLVRQLLFSEARFQFRQLRSGRPGDLFGQPQLAALEQPWPGGTTGDLLTRAIQDADLAGNFFAVRQRDRIRRLRPDWMTIVLGSEENEDAQAGDVDIEVLGYAYLPGGPGSGREPVVFLREEVTHFAPIPDPLASYRGMSWLTPVIREIQADQVATEHKTRFWEAGATRNLKVTFNMQLLKDAFDMAVTKFRAEHEGIANRFKSVFVGQGMDVEPIGTDLKEADFKAIQGAGETRIAAAAGVPPVIVGLSEGLSSATYSNYAQARRRFADGTMRPLWRNMAGSLATIIDVPDGAELWYDDRDIPFLQEDQADAAKILQTHAISIKQLVDAGFEQSSVVDAITSGDLSRLEHSGLFSVQLQPAGAKNNGTGNGQVELPAGADVE